MHANLSRLAVQPIVPAAAVRAPTHSAPTNRGMLSSLQKREGRVRGVRRWWVHLLVFAGFTVGAVAASLAKLSA